MQKLLLASTLVLLTACASGGSGSGSNNGSNNGSSTSSYLRTEVPFHTPVKSASIDVLANLTQSQGADWSLYTADLAGNGGENLVVAGYCIGCPPNDWKNSQISVFGWSNGSLVDQTSSWFNTGDNLIVGTNTIKFGSFNNNGRTDMFLGGYTDGQTNTSQAQVFFNTGSKFTRYNIDLSSNIAATELARADSRTSVSAHDAVIVDLNNDGYKDIVLSDYGWNTTLAFNNKNSTFTTYTQANRNLPGNSSLAVSDFLNNGTQTFFVVDMGGTNNRPALYSWAIDGSNNLSFSLINYGPDPRFELAKWDSYFSAYGLTVGNRSHNVRAVAVDWTGDGLDDVIVTSRATQIPGIGYPTLSEVQFLKNNGTGTFTDETDSVLVGYNTSTQVSYNIKFMDVNGDRLKDIILVNGNNTAEILLRTSDGKYSVAYQNVITDFVKQANAMQSYAWGTDGGTVTVIKSPDNKLYLLTAVVFGDQTAGRDRFAVYLSLMGDSTVTAAQALSTVQARWPYMSAINANTVLAQTAATYLNGKIIDMDAVMNPWGGLTINNHALSGSISGVQLNTRFRSLAAVDGLGRDFEVDVSRSAVHTANLWNTNTRLDDTEVTARSAYLVGSNHMNINGFKLAADSVNNNFSIGLPSYRLNNTTTVNAAVTTLNFNPWVQFNGLWGTVRSSSILETSISYSQDWLKARAGVMMNNTAINPGLVTRVNTITAGWAELGLAGKGIGIFAGITPTVLSGSIDTRIPVGFDLQGRMQYVDQKLQINSSVTSYVRAVYSDQVNKNVGYKISGMQINNGQYKVQADMRFSF